MEKEYLQKASPQGGLLSPLFSNIVLNELDQWVAESMGTISLYINHLKQEKANCYAKKRTQSERRLSSALCG